MIIFTFKADSEHQLPAPITNVEILVRYTCLVLALPEGSEQKGHLS